MTGLPALLEWLQALASVIADFFHDPVKFIGMAASILGLAVLRSFFRRRRREPLPTVDAVSDGEHQQQKHRD